MNATKGETVWNGLRINYTQQPHDNSPYSGEIDVDTTKLEIVDAEEFAEWLSDSCFLSDHMEDLLEACYEAES